MEREYWEAQVECIDILLKHCGKIIILKNRPTFMSLDMEYFSANCILPLKVVCKKNGLKFDYDSNVVKLKKRSRHCRGWHERKSKYIEKVPTVQFIFEEA